MRKHDRAGETSERKRHLIENGLTGHEFALWGKAPD